MTGAPTPDPLSPRQLQVVQRLIEQQAAAELARLRLGRGEYIRNLRLAQTVARDGTYPATGDTFAIRLVDCGFTPRSAGSSTMSCQDRTAEDNADGADDVIAREINGQYVPEGTYVAALWQRGLEGDPDDYGEWWIRIKGSGGLACWKFEDSFDRDDSTDLGSDWNEVTGDWGIEDDQLVEKYADTIGTSDAQLFTTQAIPAASAGQMFITVFVDSAAVDDVYRVYPCCEDDDTAGSVTVTFTKTDTNEWTITISGDANATVVQAAIPVNGMDVLYVCADHVQGMVYATMGNASETEGPAWADTTDPGDGRYAAIGHNNTGHQNVFDDFTFGELYLNGGSVECQGCFCRCEQNAPSKSLTLTIFDAIDRASCLDGDTIALEWEWNDSLQRWVGSGAGDLASVDAELYCAGGTMNWPLKLYPSGCFTAETYYPDEDLSTCDPFYLVYGPFQIAYTMGCSLCFGAGVPMDCYMNPTGPNCQGEFWIAITDDNE